MNHKTLIVKNIKDLEKIRNMKNIERLTIFIMKDIYIQDEYNYTPIELENTDVVIYGLCNGIYNLQINNRNKNNAGLFGNIRNLYVRNLKLSNVVIKSNEINGTLAARVAENVEIDGVEIDSVIESDAVSGGVVGTCNEIEVKNSQIFTTISGRGVLGGLAGIAEKYNLENTLLNASFKPSNTKLCRNILVDLYVGYLGEKENARVALLTEEVNEYVENKNMQRKLNM